MFGRILTSQSAARLARARHISSLELAAVGDHDRLGRRAGPRADGLDLLDDVHALGHGAEDDVLAVEPVGLDRAEEEPVGKYRRRLASLISIGDDSHHQFAFARRRDAVAARA